MLPTPKELYDDEINTIRKFYNTGEVHYLEWGTVDDFRNAVDAMDGDWECDWQWNEEEGCYDFKAWEYNNTDPDAETRLKLVGE